MYGREHQPGHVTIGSEKARVFRHAADGYESGRIQGTAMVVPMPRPPGAAGKLVEKSIGPAEPWCALRGHISTGGLHYPDFTQRHQASFGLMALCVDRPISLRRSVP